MMIRSFTELNQVLETSFTKVKKHVADTNETIDMIKDKFLKLKEHTIVKEEAMLHEVNEVKKVFSDAILELKETNKATEKSLFYLKSKLNEVPKQEVVVEQEDFVAAVKTLKKAIKDKKDPTAEIDALNHEVAALYKKLDQQNAVIRKLHSSIKSMGSDGFKEDVLEIRDKTNQMVSRKELKEELRQMHEKVGSIVSYDQAELDYKKIKQVLKQMQEQIDNISKFKEKESKKIDFLSRRTESFEDELEKLEKKKPRKSFTEEDFEIKEVEEPSEESSEPKKQKGKGFFSKVVDFFDEGEE